MNSGLILILILILVCFLVMAVIVVRAPKMDEDGLNSIMAEDLDQAERDYYDREAEKQAASCMVSFKLLALLALMYGFFHLGRFLYDWL